MNNILIVVDMQNDFIDGSLGTKEAKAIVPKVIEKIKDFQGRVFFTRDTHNEDYLNTLEGKNLPIEHCIKGTFGWEIQEDINKLRKTTPIDKETFGSKDLALLLYEENKKEKIDSITIIGLCTDICVISNALTIKAFLPETNILVDSSCCAGVTVESHKNALEALKPCQIEVL
ncbi:cysteine hydrolase family protein [Miniphocaeibacter halophilus]|uniref:Cysteine hydrolase n=1 Tax=Miniphocaeibacter halophilus TaxID=2931922 RepID=A0AC61MRC2_9FIRM|nr:isochorismatase family cysteine hydrolase [Miniphocaeibacter halophilus]QQK08122.1 cysteine hydrolase [Miniphocaeibacter halophilus]